MKKIMLVLMLIVSSLIVGCVKECDAVKLNYSIRENLESEGVLYEFESIAAEDEIEVDDIEVNFHAMEVFEETTIHGGIVYLMVDTAVEYSGTGSCNLKDVMEVMVYNGELSKPLHLIEKSPVATEVIDASTAVVGDSKDLFVRYTFEIPEREINPEDTRIFVLISNELFEVVDYKELGDGSVEFKEVVNEKMSTDEKNAGEKAPETKDSKMTSIEKEESQKNTTTMLRETESVTKINEVRDVVFSMTVSSIYSETYKGKTTIYSPFFISDNDNKTAWVEGSRIDGVDQWIVFESEDAFDLDTIQIMNGYSKSDALYGKNNRVAEMVVTSSEGEFKTIVLEDNNLDFQEFDLNFKGINSVRIVVTKVFKGTDYNDMCISEIRFNDQLLNLELSDETNALIHSIQNDLHESTTKTELVGAYNLGGDKGGFYDRDFNLIEAYNDRNTFAQFPKHFTLLENGMVSTDSGAESYIAGSWQVKGDGIVISNKGHEQFYFYKNEMLFLSLSEKWLDTYKNQYNFTTDKTELIRYEGYAKEK